MRDQSICENLVHKLCRDGPETVENRVESQLEDFQTRKLEFEQSISEKT